MGSSGWRDKLMAVAGALDKAKAAADTLQTVVNSPLVKPMIDTLRENPAAEVAGGSLLVPTSAVELGAQALLGGNVQNLRISFSDRAVEVSFNVKRKAAMAHVSVHGTGQHYVLRKPIGDVVLDTDADVELIGGWFARVWTAILLAISRIVLGVSEDAPLKPLETLRGVSVDGRQVTCHLDELEVLERLKTDGGLGALDFCEITDIAFEDGGVRVVARPVVNRDALLQLGQLALGTIAGRLAQSGEEAPG